MKIFITHYTPLKERKAHIEELLYKLNYKGYFITEFDREELDECSWKYKFNSNQWKTEYHLIKNILFKNVSNFGKKRSLKHKIYWDLAKIFEKISTPKCFRPRKLTLSEISLTLKHHKALKEIEKSDEPGLIMEDDIILRPESKQLIENSFLLCKSEFDYIDLGGGCDLPLFKEDKQLKKYHRFIKLNIPRSRTTAAYMINSKCAKVLSEGLFPLSMPIDWKYQYLFLKNNIKVGWSNPSAFIHGSQGIFKTSIGK